jgi:hypothetical protein
MLWFRWSMTQIEPAMTSVAISTPKASTSTLSVLSGAVAMRRKK